MSENNEKRGDLHAEIMNLRCTEPDHYEDAAVRMAYRVGHRDARHAAAELALAQHLQGEIPDAIKHCKTCHGEGWVCENHPDKAWNAAGCECGAGMPCECNLVTPLAQGLTDEQIEAAVIEACHSDPRSITPGEYCLSLGEIHDVVILLAQSAPRAEHSECLHCKPYRDATGELVAPLCRCKSAAPSASAQQAEQLPVELRAVAETVANGGGFWTSCTGCYDTEDGRPTQKYTHSDVFGCELGNGCRECGGLGAVWDDTDYAEMAEFMEQQAAAPAPSASPASEPSGYFEAIMEALRIERSSDKWHAAVMAHCDFLVRHGTSPAALTDADILKLWYSQRCPLDQDDEIVTFARALLAAGEKK